MTPDRVFLDTAFILGLINRDDQYHATSRRLHPVLRSARIWTTESVLTEVGNACGFSHRQEAGLFVDRLFTTTNVRVENVTTPLFRDALTLYRSRSDKDWGMTDCISFTLMAKEGLIAALTPDRHFVQAGFRALMLEES